MAIKITAWNVEGRLNGYAKSGRGTVDHILREIAALDADIVVLPEFYINALAKGVDARLEKLGYKVIETPYDDVGRDFSKWGPASIGVLSRLPLKNVEIIRPGNVRNLISCHVTEPESGEKLRIIATHLDDRSEVQRMKQVRELVSSVNTTVMPTVMLGDFNAMWREGRGRLLMSQFTRFIARHVGHKDLREVVVRAIDMATGTTLSALTTQTTLRDADSRRRPTATPKRRYALFLPSIRLIQIDHMLVSPDVVVRNFIVAHDGGSDHRAISATISIHPDKH